MINDYRQIKNPEYAESQERKNILRNLIIDGRDADAVIKYADVFVEQMQKAVVEYAKQGNTELLSKAALEYRVACKFMDLLKYSAETGRKKEETLHRIQQK